MRILLGEYSSFVCFRIVETAFSIDEMSDKKWRPGKPSRHAQFTFHQQTGDDLSSQHTPPFRRCMRDTAGIGYSFLRPDR